MVNALREARRLTMDCVQVFTANQRQWNPRPPDAQQRQQWLAELAVMNWDSATDSTVRGGPARVVSHNSYLINLASPDRHRWQCSVNAMRGEIERCESLHIPLVVAHPGAHLGGRGGSRNGRERRLPNDLHGATTPDERAGLKRIIRALDRLQRDLPGYRTITCLETTVGSGSNLGYCFHHLARIREAVTQPERVGFCFDTCHVTAAGYDMTTAERAAAVMQQWDHVCGAASLRVFHFNDSHGGIGSRLDRHAHIGEGCCSRACFRFLLNHPAFATVPKVLETPKGIDQRGREWDALNLMRLRRMMNQPLRSGTADNRRPTADRTHPLALPATA